MGSPDVQLGGGSYLSRLPVKKPHMSHFFQDIFLVELVLRDAGGHWVCMYP